MTHWRFVWSRPGPNGGTCEQGSPSETVGQDESFIRRFRFVRIGIIATTLLVIGPLTFLGLADHYRGCHYTLNRFQWIGESGGDDAGEVATAIMTLGIKTRTLRLLINVPEHAIAISPLGSLALRRIQKGRFRILGITVSGAARECMHDAAQSEIAALRRF